MNQEGWEVHSIGAMAVVFAAVAVFFPAMAAWGNAIADVLPYQGGVLRGCSPRSRAKP